MKGFTSPTSLGNLDAESASSLIAAASDVALVIDADGIIIDVAFNERDLPANLADQHWIGRLWIETVTHESRTKVQSLLSDAVSAAEPQWRQINHPGQSDTEVPILYSAVLMEGSGRVVAFGRDLRSTSALQQRLIDAQQSMERDYLRLRHTETRYRLLFQISAEAVLVVRASTLKVLEANAAARRLFGPSAKRVLARPLPTAFDSGSVQAIHTLFSAVRAAGRADAVQAKLADKTGDVLVSAYQFRQDEASLFFVRLVPVGNEAADAGASETKEKLLRFIERAPDAFVVTTADGRILTANDAFLDMAQLPSEEQARGELLDRWLGRPGADLGVLTTTLRQHGSVRLFTTSLRGDFGATAEVEISAASVNQGSQQSFGFAIRNVDRRLDDSPRRGRELPRSLEQLTELIGRVSLKDLVRETTDLIERLCIEAALELTGDNRASAAEMLGLSRQSLYIKLHRYGLGDRDGENEEQEQQN